MSITLAQTQLTLRQKLLVYFFHLNLFQQTTFGILRVVRRNLWLAACYLFFVFGILSRQIVIGETVLSLNSQSLNLKTLVASFLVGLALYPFALRIIVKIVSKTFEVDPLKNPNKTIEGFNIIHLAASFGIGYFFNLLIQKVPVVFDSLVKLVI